MEIGTFRGGALFVFSQLAAPGATMISLDFHMSFFGKVYGALQKPLLRKFVRNGKSLFAGSRENSPFAPDSRYPIRSILRGRQSSTSSSSTAIAPTKSVREDFMMYSPLVREGGLIAFHDIADSGGSREVHRLWTELKPNYQHEEFIHVTGDRAAWASECCERYDCLIAAERGSISSIRVEALGKCQFEV